MGKILLIKLFPPVPQRKSLSVHFILVLEITRVFATHVPTATVVVAQIHAYHVQRMQRQIGDSLSLDFLLSCQESSYLFTVPLSPKGNSKFPKWYWKLCWIIFKWQTWHLCFLCIGHRNLKRCLIFKVLFQPLVGICWIQTVCQQQDQQLNYFILNRHSMHVFHWLSYLFAESPSLDLDAASWRHGPLDWLVESCRKNDDHPLRRRIIADERHS